MSWLDEELDEDVEDERVPFSVRLGDWRRHYFPLPDEVIAEYLAETEYVIHSDRRTARGFYRYNRELFMFVFVLYGTNLWSATESSSFMPMWWLAGLAAIAIGLALLRLHWSYRTYVVTNLGMLRCSGFIGRDVARLPWRWVLGISYQSGTIRIESATVASGLHELTDLHDMALFYEQVLEGLAVSRGERDGGDR